MVTTKPTILASITICFESTNLQALVDKRRQELIDSARVSENGKEIFFPDPSYKVSIFSDENGTHEWRLLDPDADALNDTPLIPQENENEDTSEDDLAQIIQADFGSTNLEDIYFYDTGIEGDSLQKEIDCIKKWAAERIAWSLIKSSAVESELGLPPGSISQISHLGSP